VAEFANKERGVRFTLPEKITVRNQLLFYSLIGESEGPDKYEGYWAAAKMLIEDWECKRLPETNVDLGKIEDPKITSIILWVGTQVLSYMANLGDVSKN